MSYLDQPNYSGDGVAGGLMSVCGAAAATTACAVLIALPEMGVFVFAGLPGFLVVFLLAFVTGCFTFCFVGLPATLLLRWAAREGAVAYSLVGAVAGVTTARLSFAGILGELPADEIHGVVTAVVGCVAGAVGGLVWWRTFRRHFQETGD